MKNILVLLILGLTILSCKVTEKPEFIEIKSMDIVDTSLENFTIQANVVFKNKNQIGGTLQANDIHIFVDSMDVATVQSELFKVPKESEFTIPLKATIPFEKVFADNKKNLLDKILNVIANKKINMSFKGKVRYKLGAFHYDYPVDYQQEISLRK